MPLRETKDERGREREKEEFARMESSLYELRESTGFQMIVRALATLCHNEFHDGDRRNIKKWLEKR